MILDLQFRLKNDALLKQFLRENSYWYKYLNRDFNYLKNVIEDMKDKYEMNPSDKINKMINNISMLQSFLDVFK